MNFNFELTYRNIDFDIWGIFSSNVLASSLQQIMHMNLGYEQIWTQGVINLPCEIAGLSSCFDSSDAGSDSVCVGVGSEIFSPVAFFSTVSSGRAVFADTTCNNII